MKIGFTCGSFDLCHYGHALMLEECRGKCDKLIVGVQKDPTIDRPHKNKPIQSIEERVGQVKAIKWVDEVVVYETESDLLDYLSKNKNSIHIRFVGADWRGKPFTGKSLGIEIQYNSRTHGYSSSELRKRIENSKFKSFADQIFHKQKEIDQLETKFFTEILALISDHTINLADVEIEKIEKNYDNLVKSGKLPEFWEFDYNEGFLVFDQCPTSFEITDDSAKQIWLQMGFKNIILYYEDVTIPANHIDCSKLLT